MKIKKIRDYSLDELVGFKFVINKNMLEGLK